MAFILSGLNNFFLPSELRAVERGYLPKVDTIYYVFAGSFMWCLLSSVAYSIVSYRKVTNREKRRLKWLFIIMLLTSALGMSSLYLMAYDFYLSKLVGTAANIIVITSLLYATIQRNLMDIHLALSMGAARLILLSLFTWFYFSIGLNFREDGDSFGGMLMILVFFMIVLEIYPVLLRWVLKSAKKFAGDGHDYAETTESTQAALSCCTSTRQLVGVLDRLFYRILRMEKYQLFIFDPSGKNGNSFRSMNSMGAVSQSERGVLLEIPDSLSAVVMEDEAEATLRANMNAAGVGAAILVRNETGLLAVIFVGYSLMTSYYRHDDIRVFEWLSIELSQMLTRIQTLEAFEDELYDAKKRLSLLSMMNHYHHDIKAPLSVIDGVVSHQLYDSEKQRQVILEQVALGSKLIATMASLLNGKRRRRIAPVDLQQVLNECLVLFRQKLAKVDVKLCDGAVVQGDADDLKIMFINLIKNAAEAAQPGGKVSLAVKARLQDDCVSVSIRDNGVGMEAEKLGRIWESPASSKPGGHGIGLQAIKRIADEHDTLIDVISRPGEGSEFILSFPLVVPALRFADTA